MILAAGTSLSACGGAAEAAGNPGIPATDTAASSAASAPASSEPAAGGYDGWWNATPASGSTAGLPQETVAINTRTNTVVDAFSRKINDAGRPTRLADVPYTVVPDPSWPAESVVIIDTATNTMIENFRVDLNGNPLR
ncbi:hypothetical protein [Arthrobacter sp. PsM3]|uniref:hypothetical protein n=1 Tax=Arthrobacter sp. PsM3 TaxID=3030531 RepID=UPI00263BDCEB|nr:hypothetical protein [Arthrobacter sp. PsM3]MDN4644770.1 hypothetical protein [Arthrobacter sp. PsM3]